MIIIDLKKRRGPKKRLTERVNSRIKRARKIRNNCGLVTAKKVRDEAAPEFSIRRIQMELKKLGFRYQIIEKYLPLTPQHKEKRATFFKCPGWKIITIEAFLIEKSHNNMAAD